MSELLILTGLGIWGIFLDFGGREHIIILSSLMELSCEGRKTGWSLLKQKIRLSFVLIMGTARSSSNRP